MDNLKGMTINERLYAMHKIDEFDSAIKSGDTQKAIKLLELCELNYSSASDTVSAIINNPKQYGY